MNSIPIWSPPFSDLDWTQSQNLEILIVTILQLVELIFLC